MNCSCVYCKKEFSVKGIFCHVDRVHLGKNQYSNGNNGKYEILSNRAKENRLNKEKEYNKAPKKCLCCDSIIPFSEKNNKFCCRSCSAIYTNARKDWNKIKTGRVRAERVTYQIKCNGCNSYFSTTNSNKKYCNSKCAGGHKSFVSRQSRPEFINYRADCAFKFDLKNYPNEFDFTLIEQHGWYKPSNRGCNLDGVSRDHMVSVRFGFDNNIDPKIISHPANCRLIKQKENSSKHSKSSLTINQLVDRIKEWEDKYQ